jgi:monothiol glutaredoxin
MPSPVRSRTGAAKSRQETTMSEQTVHDWIRKTVSSNDVVVFMKGTKQFPQCGFSGQVAQILGHVGVAYKDVNVLEDMSIREGIKSFSEWPTIPQLYVKGEFIGGCDIIREMFQEGELTQLLDEKHIPYDKSKLSA